MVKLAGFLTSLASWCEGCQCHEDELISSGTYFLRSKVTRHENTSCCYKGRRAPELAAGFLKQHVDWLASSAMTELLGFIEGVPPDQSSKILEDFHTACDRALLEIQIKTHHWEELPWALAACAHHDVDMARATLRKLRDRFLKTETSKHVVCMTGSVSYLRSPCFSTTKGYWGLARAKHGILGVMSYRIQL